MDLHEIWYAGRGSKILQFKFKPILNIQNGRHYDVITKIIGIGHNYKSVNNEWIPLKFKLEIVHVNNVFFKKLLILIFQNGRHYDAITKNHGKGRSMLNKEGRDMQVVSKCRY